MMLAVTLHLNKTTLIKFCGLPCSHNKHFMRYRTIIPEILLYLKYKYPAVYTNKR